MKIITDNAEECAIKQIMQLLSIDISSSWKFMTGQIVILISKL